jgi:hypothetical protein
MRRSGADATVKNLPFFKRFSRQYAQIQAELKEQGF